MSEGNSALLLHLNVESLGSINRSPSVDCAEKVSALPAQTFTPRLCNYAEVNQKLWVWLIVLIRRAIFFSAISHFQSMIAPLTPQQTNDVWKERRFLPSHIVSIWTICRLNDCFLALFDFRCQFFGSEMTQKTTELIFRAPQSILCLSDIRRNIDFNVKLLYFDLSAFLTGSNSFICF